MDEKPCKTLYFRNLNEKTNCHELRRRLEILVSRYVRVSEIVTRRAFKLRGQAFVTLESVEDAKRIKSLLHRFFFMGKVVEVHFAREVTKKHRKREESEKRNFHPCKILVVKDLDEGVTKEDLEKVLGETQGLLKIRHVPAKKVALVDFLDVDSCQACCSAHENGLSVHGKKYAMDCL